TGEILDRAERAMRAAITEVPDGTYEYAIETDGADEPYRFALALTVDGDRIHADFTGTSPTQPRAINCVMAYTYAMTAYAIKCTLLPDLPNNDGMFRPITVHAPPDTLVNPSYPAAVVARSNTGHYVPVCVFGALARVLPERVMAGAGSPLWVFTVTGLDDSGKPFANVLFFNGGMGAAHGADGESCLSWPSNISSTPVEIAERNGPLLCLYKRLQPGSGGDGQWRGGLGQEMLFECTAERSVTALFMAERTRFAAPGLLGGGDGETGTIEINGEVIDHRRQHVLHKGDRVLIRTPGGGGYGSPVRRDPGAQRLDRALGLIEETTNDA
ncbi:MAG: hydantoinase B/oxoprolinase family protein, partial [Gammaproteobacteria bacterium]|nr:hydantoinase B/oxoprolinase family protein [Gammaproteobacteria bacterium]